MEAYGVPTVPTIAVSHPTALPTVTTQPYRSHPVHQQNTGIQEVRQPNPRPSGQWYDSIFDCSQNLWPSCWCSCCCCHGAYLLGQISERIGYLKLKLIVSLYSLFMLFMFFFANSAIYEGAEIDNTVFWFMGIFPVVFMALISSCVRVKFITKMGIMRPNEGTCKICMEYLTGLLCGPCSTCQMARHMFGYTKILDGDSDVYKPDYYDV